VLNPTGAYEKFLGDKRFEECVLHASFFRKEAFLYFERGVGKRTKAMYFYIKNK
jgi:hypothetical protein